MKPEYVQKVRDEVFPLVPPDTVATPAGSDIKQILEAINSVEANKYGTAQLAFEGLLRVIKDRFGCDENRQAYLDHLNQSAGEKALGLLSIILGDQR